MASGSFPVYTSNQYISGAVTWSSVPNTAGNYSDVTATLRLSRTNTGFTTEGRGSFTISIDGHANTYDNGGNQFKFTYNSNTYCVSHTRRVYHGADGKRDVPIAVSGGISRFTVNSKSERVTLDTIPRYAKITSFTLSSATCIQFKINYAVDRTIDSAQYRIGSGSWSTIPSNGIITGRSPNTSYSVQIRVRNAASGLWTESGKKSIKTVALSSVSSGVNFNLESSLGVTLSRGNSNVVHDIYLEAYYDGAWRDVAKNTLTNIGTSATVTPTNGAVATLQNKHPNTKSVQVRLRVVCRWGSGGAVQGTVYKSGTASIVNANPSIASVSYLDTNATVQAILGNNQKILRNRSTLQVTAGLAKSQKGATLKSYKVTIGGNEYTVSASGTEQDGRTINVGKVNQAANQTAVLTVIDSRGNTASRSFTVQIIDYMEPQILQASADRLNNYERPTDMNIEARRAVVKPGSVDVNEIYLRYRIKENPSGSYGNWINLTRQNGSISGIWQSVTVSQYMADYPNNKSYTVEVGISDNFTDEDTTLVPLPEGIAILRFLQDRIDAGVPIYDQATEQPYLFFAESEEW